MSLPHAEGIKLQGPYMKVLVTGGAGLVGTECCKLFASEGWEVISVDNYMRAKIFGRDAETKGNIQNTCKNYGLEHHELDIRDERVVELVKKVRDSAYHRTTVAPTLDRNPHGGLSYKRFWHA